jgi:hypothetical protein
VDRRALAQATVDRIQRGVRAYRQARDPGVLLDAAWRSLLATAFLVAALVGLAWAFRRLEAGFNRRYARKVPSVQIQSFEIMRAHRVRAVFRGALRALRASVAAVLVYSWLQFVLGSFPGTRPLATRLLTLLLDPLSRIGAGLLSLIPDLAFLLVLYVLTRGLLRFARLYFDAVGCSWSPSPWWRPTPTSRGRARRPSRASRSSSGWCSRSARPRSSRTSSPGTR